MINDKRVYNIRTPDNNFISFQLANKSEVKKLLSCGNYKILPDEQLDFYHRKAYLLKDGRVIYIKSEYDSIFYLVDDLNNYLRIIKGKRYFESGIISNSKDNEVYSSFSLNSNAIGDFLKKKPIILNKYPSFDGYICYSLPGGAITFIRNRINNIYDGYWYPTVKDFEYFYYSLTTDNYRSNKLRTK